MNDSQITLVRPAEEKPALPVPARLRWQPLRLGLVDLFHYDSEEFWFRDGHLLLRGNNGTGKSKVLSLTLPFLLDGQLKPSRIEPDGDPAKKMAWNLLMNSYDRRIGYAWIEFGRRGEDGAPRYLSLGAGLSASAARPQVESWFFLLDDAPDAPRINHDLWLMSPQRVVLTRERLRDQVEGHGQVFDNARQYRRAVDERLFRLGPKRYDALMDTLIQLRQPQLSKKPDETALSNALTEALPPLAPELLADVAEALGQLEEDRRQFAEYQELAKAVGRFEQRYRVYAGTQSRRQARMLRQAQTEFDNASRAHGDAQARLDEARAGEERARTDHDEADVALKRARARLETLYADPTMRDANRLEAAEKDALARRQAMEAATVAAAEAGRRLQRGIEEAGHAAERAADAERVLGERRREAAAHAEAAGIARPHSENPLAAFETAALVAQTRRGFDRASADLDAMVAVRREQIELMRLRHDEMRDAEGAHRQCRQTEEERRAEAEAAAERSAETDAEVERQGRAFVDRWERHIAGLEQLDVDPADGAAALAALAEWVVAMEGENPAGRLLDEAQQRASRRFAERGVALDDRRRSIDDESRALEDERRGLEAGVDLSPPAPYTRAADARGGRAGAPLWQLVDFRDTVAAPQRAGLEAALEAAGLLDAWITPDGRVQLGDGGTVLQDTQLVERRPAPASLAACLLAAVPAESTVPAGTVERLLSAVACADEDTADSEAWVSPEGRFRLGALTGAWIKPAAVYIGHSARAAARRRRLAEIAARLAELAEDRGAVDALAEQLARDRHRAGEEWRLAPDDGALRGAHAAAVAAARETGRARERLAEAERRRSEAGAALDAARGRLAADAADLRLPEAPAGLRAVEAAVGRYRDEVARLVQAVHELRLALPELARHRVREEEARDDVRRCGAQLATARDEMEEARARLEALREAVGTRVEELQRKLADARIAADAGDDALKHAGERLREAGEVRAVAEEKATAAEAAVRQRGEARAETVSRLQRFAATGLLSAALPEAELPDMASAWTIDPALTLARRVEQALSTLRDDDEAWGRIQRQIAEELTELQSALGALGHQAPAEPSDWELIVHIVYQNRAERPDRLAGRLAEEIAQRAELLTAKERAVLENHLQAEIATEVQRLLQAAERQLDAINRELHKRPTSTGMRYRLLWQPLGEEEGAPIGLEAARKHLLNTSADLWSADDRNVVGAMLQQRIAAERELADSGAEGGSLLDQLARALDYRRWHRFRVERWQDGRWRRLSGPASSGERALGLTVPLFAAVASFYSQGSDRLAPRLILLDEAFAGIDDAARAHCMGLIREFELDFVITSEREWGCYAELPGVSICHLQRHEGIEAVFVSRWTWDGRAIVGEPDPDRRFAPA